MHTISVRGVTLGAGRPKIIVPLCETAAPALAAEAARLAAAGAELVEWRVDAMDGARDTAALLEAAPAVRAALGDVPLLATCRTRAEGGAGVPAGAAYGDLCRALCASGCIDLIDLELSAGDALLAELIGEAHRRGVVTVLSSHDFSATPPRAEMVDRLCRMQALGADIAKLAVMPQSRRDVAELLAATAEMTELHPQTPVITMSMGPLGLISRLAGEAFGSAATFAAAGHTSAPGQPPLDKAAALLDGLHGLYTL